MTFIELTSYHLPYFRYLMAKIFHLDLGNLRSSGVKVHSASCNPDCTLVASLVKIGGTLRPVQCSVGLCDRLTDSQTNWHSLNVDNLLGRWNAAACLDINVLSSLMKALVLKLLRVLRRIYTCLYMTVLSSVLKAGKLCSEVVVTELKDHNQQTMTISQWSFVGRHFYRVNTNSARLCARPWRDIFHSK